ncbi:hypothetical protein [Anabaena sp. CCY 9402-a]|uniref:hypothetical protein n=1 Tax=Anabaena sp. CCY 9402-a TaxID=3103867 RepID=UPI0039C62F6A
MTFLNKNFLLNAVFLLSFFPFIKFIPFITAEVQPFATFFAGMYLIAFRRKKIPELYVLWYLIIIFIYLCIALIKNFINPYSEVTISHILESTFIFLTPLIIFLALFNNLTLLSVNCLRFSIYSWFFISILQQYFPFVLSATGVSSILSSIISRFSDESLGGSRGVAGFAPEPSYASFIIILMFAFSIFIYKIHKIHKNEFKLMLLACIIMAFLNRSASIFSLFIIFYIFYNLIYLYQNILNLFKSKNSSQKLKKFVWVSLLILTSFIIFWLLPNIIINLLPNSRIADLLSAFSSLHQQKKIGLSDVLELTNNLGSQRSISVYVGYFNAVDTYGFGSGIGSWGTNFLDALEKSGFNPSEIKFFIYNGFRNSKPYAYAALLAFDMGFIGLISLSTIFIIAIIRRFRINREVTKYAWACLGLSLFILYFNCVASLPTGWLMFLIFLQDPKSVTTSNSDN